MPVRLLLAVAGVVVAAFAATAVASPPYLGGDNRFIVYTGPDCPGFGVYVGEDPGLDMPGYWYDGAIEHPAGEYVIFPEVNMSFHPTKKNYVEYGIVYQVYNVKADATVTSGGHVYSLTGHFTGYNETYEGKVKITRDDGASTSGGASISPSYHELMEFYLTSEWKCRLPK